MEEQILYDSIYRRFLGGSPIQRDRREMVGARGLGENGQLVFREDRVSDSQDDRWWGWLHGHINVLNATELDT